MPPVKWTDSSEWSACGILWIFEQVYQEARMMTLFYRPDDFGGKLLKTIRIVVVIDCQPNNYHALGFDRNI